MRFLWLFALILPVELMAQVTVRTGDHPTFSRIVLSIPVGTSWSVEQTIDGADIRLDGIESINLDGFFDRIQKDRIATSSVSAGKIKLQLNCNCGIDAFLWRPDRLVVDVLDAAGLDTPPQDGLGNAAVPFALPLLIETEPSGVILPGLKGLTDERSQAPDDRVDIATTDTVMDDRASLIKEALMNDLARAAVQGLVDLPEDSGIVETGDASSIADQLEAALSGIEGTPGVTFRTSADGFRSDTINADKPDLERCGYAEQYAVSDWGDDASFAEQISRRRLALVADLDGSQKPDIDALARTYLYFGFGREAIETIETDGLMDNDRVALIQIAKIIDDDEVVDFPASQELVQCTSEIALWAFLASTDPLDPNRNAILQAFRRLPAGLQAHLSPRLAQRFLEIGDADAAEMILNPNRSNPDRTIESDIVEIALLVEDSPIRSQEVSTELVKISSAPERLTPESLLSLMRSNRENNLVADSQLMDLAQIMRFEAQDKPIAIALGIEEIRSAASSGDIDRAIRVRDETRIAPELLIEIDDEIAMSALDGLSDISFLDLILSDRLQINDASLENGFADRLLSLGFPENASDLLETPAIGPAMMERRYLRAEAALALSDFARIDSILAGITTERANALRQARDAKLAGFTIISDGATETDLSKRSDEVAWRSGDWSELLTADDILLSTAAALRLAQGAAELPATDAPIAQAYELLDDSSSLQSLLGEISDRFVLPAD